MLPIASKRGDWGIRGVTYVTRSDRLSVCDQISKYNWINHITDHLGNHDQCAIIDQFNGIKIYFDNFDLSKYILRVLIGR